MGRRFSRKSEKDVMLLYFTYIITLIQLFYLVVHQKYKALLFFFVIGLALHLFIKNIPMVLILDIIITNILMKTIIKREGMEGADDTGKEDKDVHTEEDKQKEMPAPGKKPEGFADKTKNVHKDSAKTKNKKGVAEQATPVESFENHEKKMKSVNDSILMLSNLMDKFSGISSKLGFKT